MSQEFGNRREETAPRRPVQTHEQLVRIDPERLPLVYALTHPDGILNCYRTNEMKLAALEERIRQGQFGPQQFRTELLQFFDAEPNGWDPIETLFDDLCHAGRSGHGSPGLDDEDQDYLATPLTIVESAVSEGYITSEDRVADIGCGPGARLPIYLHLRIGADILAVEKSPVYAGRAVTRVSELGLQHAVRVEQAEALTVDYSGVTVFLLWQPFSKKKTLQFMEILRPQFEGRETSFLAHGGSEKVLASVEWIKEVKQCANYGPHVFQPR